MKTFSVKIELEGRFRYDVLLVVTCESKEEANSILMEKAKRFESVFQESRKGFIVSANEALKMFNKGDKNFNNFAIKNCEKTIKECTEQDTLKKYITANIIELKQDEVYEIFPIHRSNFNITKDLER
jgi:hypothetical protein